MGAGQIIGALGGGAGAALLSYKLSGKNTLAAGIAGIAGGVIFSKVGAMIEEKMAQKNAAKEVTVEAEAVQTVETQPKITTSEALKNVCDIAGSAAKTAINPASAITDGLGL